MENARLGESHDRKSNLELEVRRYRDAARRADKRVGSHYALGRPGIVKIGDELNEDIKRLINRNKQ